MHVCSGAIDGTSTIRGGRCRDLIALEAEVGDKLDFTASNFFKQTIHEGVVHREGMISLIGNKQCVFYIHNIPIDEIVSHVRCGDEGDLVTIMDGLVVFIANSIIGRAAVFRNNGEPWVEFDLHKVGYIAAGSDDIESVFRFPAYHPTVLCPVVEYVSWIGRRRQGARGTIVVCASSRDGTTLGGIGGDSDVEALELEVGDVGSSSSYLEGVGGTGADLLSILGPVDEAVSRIGCCGYRATLAKAVFSTA